MFTELGNLTIKYSSVESKLAKFIKDQFPSIVTDLYLNRAFSEDKDQFPLNIGKTLDTRIRAIEELKKED